jgi:hypothetical protein
LHFANPFARLLDGIERGRPVPPTLVLSSSAWTPPVLLLVLGAVAVGAFSGLSSQAVIAMQRVGARLGVGGQSLPAGGLEVLLALAGFVFLFTVSSLSWTNRLIIVLGGWAAGTYSLGLLSWAAIQTMIVRLADQPGVDVFAPPPPGVTDAGLVLAFAVLLAPVLGLVLLVLVWAWSAFAQEMFRPVTRGGVVPAWLVTAPFVAALVGVAYVGTPVWMPWCLWVLGVIARAYMLALG